MSVDDELRRAFGETDPRWERDAPAALRAVTARRRRERVLVRTGAAALAAAAAVTVVAVAGARGGSDPQPAPVLPPPTAPPPGDQTPPASSPSVLQGRWRTRPLGADDVRAALDEAGAGDLVGQVLSGLRPRPFRLEWLVTYETAELRLVSGGRTTVVDQTSVVVGGDVVTVAPRFADGATIHRFSVDGDHLRLTFVSTTEGVSDGVPGEVWQRLLYDAFGFVRQ